MSKIFNVYSNNVDKAWYQSSNVMFSECEDHDDALKTLRVVFANGGRYEYKDVDVRDYLLFREAASQGKALNEYIRKKDYKFEKLDNADTKQLEKELEFRLGGGYFITYDGTTLKISDGKDSVIYEKEIKLTEESLDMACDIVSSLGHEIHVDRGDTFYLLNDTDKVVYNDRS